MLRRPFLRLLAAVFAVGIAILPARTYAQADKPEMREGCPGLVAAPLPRIIPASLQLAALAGDEVRISYAGHSTFLIESPQSVRIATDYNDYVRVPGGPTIATMNHAHDTHFSAVPDPAIAHVLRGWSADERPAHHDLQVQDVRVRSVPTNIRNWSGGTERHGNSIFIFEIAGLCVAHLGHLHHTLNQQQLDEIGRIDVVLVPVDGSFTLGLEEMMEVLRALKAPLMIPMHYFSAYTLQRFLDRTRSENWEIERSIAPALVVSRRTLPSSPKGDGAARSLNCRLHICVIATNGNGNLCTTLRITLDLQAGQVFPKFYRQRIAAGRKTPRQIPHEDVMIGNWSSWKRFPNAERGEHVEAPIGPGIYEVRKISNGDLAAFDAAANVAHALSALIGKSPSFSWARLFGGGRNAWQGTDLEYRTCAASSVNEARVMAQALLGRRQVYWRRSAAQANFVGSI